MSTNAASLRIQKLLSERGLCSRRLAEDWILEGRVEVNGKTATLGQKVDPDQDHIKVDGSTIPLADPTHKVLAMNKLKGFVCTHEEGFEAPNIYSLLPTIYKNMKWICVGRLDKESEGLLILTTDGDLANKLMHPSFEVIKRYQVTLNKPFDPAHIEKMLKGVRWDGERLFAKRVLPISRRSNEQTQQIEVHMTQGRKREIRYMCLALGYQVKRLKRFQIGKYVLKSIPGGSVRELKSKDIQLLLKK